MSMIHKYLGNPEQIVVSGSSAGGFGAALLAGKHSNIGLSLFDIIPEK